MKKNLLITLLLSLMLFGCGANKVITNVRYTDDRPDRYSLFEEVSDHNAWKIIYQKKTDVMYVVSNGKYNRGVFTLMVDANGNPLLYDENITDHQFVVVDQAYGYMIVYHEQTNVMYSVTSGYNQGVFTLLVDADGKPLLY